MESAFTEQHVTAGAPVQLLLCQLVEGEAEAPLQLLRRQQSFSYSFCRRRSGRGRAWAKVCAATQLARRFVARCCCRRRQPSNSSRGEGSGGQDASRSHRADRNTEPKRRGTVSTFCIPPTALSSFLTASWVLECFHHMHGLPHPVPFRHHRYLAARAAFDRALAPLKAQIGRQ